MKLTAVALSASVIAACAPAPTDVGAYPSDLTSGFEPFGAVRVEINQDADPAIELAVRSESRLIGPSGEPVLFTFSYVAPVHSSWASLEVIPDAPLTPGWHDLQLTLDEGVVASGFHRDVDGTLHLRVNPALDPVVASIEACSTMNFGDAPPPARVTVKFSEPVGVASTTQPAVTVSVDGVAAPCFDYHAHPLPTATYDHPFQDRWTLSCDRDTDLAGRLRVTVTTAVQNTDGMTAHAFGQPDAPFEATFDTSALSQPNECVEWAPD